MELLYLHRIMEVLNPPNIFNPLSVSVHSKGKKSLILDLRYINKFIVKQRVKYEDWKIALSHVQKGAYMIRFDLTSGYHHLDIHPNLEFAWRFPGENVLCYFAFTALPFGLFSAPYIHKMAQELLEKCWRIN